ncbi:MAG TPA: ATP-binding cassette domain-containing protein [Isosphaeraceae bacterium]|nr:ATP-binding cassette domain-containing protein [Isosphaeraceae bacterium]
MSGDVLEARVERQVHRGLRLDVELALGAERALLFGASGAGKTTLLRLLAGLLRPDAGFIRLGDRVLFDRPGRPRPARPRVDVPLRARGIGFIFQDDLLFTHLDVYANIRYGLRGRERAAARFDEVVGLCGVGHLLGRRPATLSGGERQRVGLARALATRPRLLLCDESFSALDPSARYDLIARLRHVQEAEAIPVLYVSHFAREAIPFGARVFAMHDGRMIVHGTRPLDVLSRSGEGLAGVLNVFEGVVEGHDDHGSTRLRLDGGPTLVVPYNGQAVGARLTVGVGADDIVLARGPVAGVSARNVLAARVERVVARGAEAEVLATTGALTWVVGVTAPAVAALGLAEGAEVALIVKARSCHILDARP